MPIDGRKRVECVEFSRIGRMRDSAKLATHGSLGIGNRSANAETKVISLADVANVNLRTVGYATHADLAVSELQNVDTARTRSDAVRSRELLPLRRMRPRLDDRQEDQ